MAITNVGKNYLAINFFDVKVDNMNSTDITLLVQFSFMGLVKSFVTLGRNNKSGFTFTSNVVGSIDNFLIVQNERSFNMLVEDHSTFFFTQRGDVDILLSFFGKSTPVNEKIAPLSKRSIGVQDSDSYGELTIGVLPNDKSLGVISLSFRVVSADVGVGKSNEFVVKNFTIARKIRRYRSFDHRCRPL